MRFPFDVRVPQEDELTPTSVTIKEGVIQNALVKASSVGKLFRAEQGAKRSPFVVVGADTLVLQGDRVLGKPENREQASSHLKLLSGRPHQVLTGLAFVDENERVRTSLTTSQVVFRTISDSELASYLDMAEPYDKAGAYALQGAGCLFIDRIEGSYTNVIGLPMEVFLTEVSAFVGVPPLAWFERANHAR